MLAADETFALTGHPVGGVCPFGLATALPIYLDESLKAFDVVYPAGGSLNTSVRVSIDRLFELVGDRWVDLTRLPEETSGT
jgi:prolyl-tRNA editing enzyme YbaK/EbsC (Cys-tRNA(Pro) deacylase)